MRLVLPQLLQRQRRDGRQLVGWVVGTAVLAYASCVGVAQSYATADERAALVRTAVANPVILLFRGLPSGAGEGAVVAFSVLPWLALLAALMTSFLVVRHTRAEEESGRAELVAATPAARATATVATVLHATIADLVLGAATAVALVAGGLPTAPSVLTGAAAGAVGLVFGAVALVAAQLLHSSRAANATAVAVIVGTFVVAGAGNALGTPADDALSMRSSPLTWVSPFGWADNTRPYDQDLWWPVLLTAAATAALGALALRLQHTRDVGAGLLAERAGRAAARPLLRTPTALVLRLSAPSVTAWVTGAVVVGVLATSLSSVVDQLGGGSASVREVLEKLSAQGDLAQGVLVVFFQMVGIFAACAAVQTVVRARQEEVRGTAEPVLALPWDRVRWLRGFVLVAVGAVAAVVLAAVLGAAVGAAASGTADPLLGDAAVAGAGALLAALVFVAATALLFVLLPRLVLTVAWSLVLVATVLGLFGPLLGLPGWTSDLSPFASSLVPSGGAVDLRGSVALVVTAVAGTALALVLMRRRELAGPG